MKAYRISLPDYKIAPFDDLVADTPILNQRLSIIQEIYLQELGIDFIVVGPTPKYKAGWSFLQKKDFEERFLKPQKILQNCLLRDAVMIYEHKGFALYRIRN